MHYLGSSVLRQESKLGDSSLKAQVFSSDAYALKFTAFFLL